MSDRFRPLSDGLGPVLAELERRAQATVDLAARVRAMLTGPEKDHVISAAYKDQTLIVMADSAAWATHIKYAQAELLAGLQAAGETRFTKLKVRVGRRPTGERRTADGGQ